MITLNYKKKVIGGIAPYSFNISSSNPCTTISPINGISNDGVLDFTVNFLDTDCLEGNQINITGSDNSGCPFSFVVPTNNDCGSLVLDSISQSSPFTFSVSSSRPGCVGNLTFEWSFDNTLFNTESQLDSGFTSSITLKLNPFIQQYPDTTEISVKVTDCVGCEKTVTHKFGFCEPSYEDSTTDLYCSIDSSSNFLGFVHNNLVLPVTSSCVGVDIDWSTLSIESQASDYELMSFTNNNDGTINIVADSSLANTTQIIRYSVENTQNIRTPSITIVANILECIPQSSTIVLGDIVDTIDASLSPGDTINIPVDSAIVAGNPSEVDWTTFNVNSTPTSSSPSIVLATDINGVHSIAYTLPNPITTDTFTWTVCDLNSNCAQSSTVTLIEPSVAPSAVDESACSICKAPVIIDVQSNDIAGGSQIVANSTQIVTLPSLGSVQVLSDGKIKYTPESDVQSATTFQYTIQDVLGNTSNTATVTVTVICSGQNSTYSVCQ